MSVRLDKPLKRELSIGHDAYTLTIAPDGLKLVPKGRRKGVELLWHDLVSGQAALAAALNASLERIAGWDGAAPEPPVAPVGGRARAAPPAPARSRKPAPAPAAVSKRKQRRTGPSSPARRRR